MPYIKQEERDNFDRVLYQIESIETKGQLEYCIFKLLKIYMVGKKPSYTELHNATYACQHVSDEFRRRFLDKREDAAIIENGEIL